MRAPAPIRIALLVPLALVATACLHTSAERRESALAADRERIAAMIAADASRLDALLHDSLTYAHSNGRIDSKTSLIDGLVSGRVDYRSIEIDESSARVHGGSAVVTARARMEVEAEGRELFLANAYTAVYWWESGRWQLAAYRSGPLP